jgi:hypothetical protein
VGAEERDRGVNRFVVGVVVLGAGLLAGSLSRKTLGPAVGIPVGPVAPGGAVQAPTADVVAAAKRNAWLKTWGSAIAIGGASYLVASRLAPKAKLPILAGGALALIVNGTDLPNKSFGFAG